MKRAVAIFWGVYLALFGLAVVAMVSACGGGAPGQPIPEITAGAAVSKPGDTAQAAVSETPKTAVSTPDQAPTWSAIWAEDWRAPVLGGWVQHNAIRCGGQADPDQVAPGSFSAGATWSPFGQVEGLSFTSSGFTVDDTQHGAGWALLSHQAHDHRKPLRLAGVLQLQPDPGAWLGLTLIGDESDYRELALYESGGQLRVGLWAPCYWRDLQAVGPGPRRLALAWTPGSGWAYELDGKVIATEAADHLGAALVQPARAGLYVVNIGAESGRLPSGRIRATVGPLTIEARP